MRVVIVIILIMTILIVIMVINYHPHILTLIMSPSLSCFEFEDSDVIIDERKEFATIVVIVNLCPYCISHCLLMLLLC